MKTKTKEIDYYGDKDNYIHLKFGNAWKAYNFTGNFIKEYPDFTKAYVKYFMREKSEFENAFQVVQYVYEHKIPVHFYFNFTDTPAKNKEEIMEYLVSENSYVGDLTK